MQLSPLQSRLAASLGASLFIFALYLLLFTPKFASATEISINHVVRADPSLEGSGPLEISYEPDFAAFDRSLIGRAPSGVTPIDNNEFKNFNADPGSIVCYMVEKSTIFGRDTVIDRSPADNDDDESEESNEKTKSKTVYLSANTCLQPYLKKKGKDPIPQLRLYVSTSSDVTCPSTAAELSKMKLVEFDEGAVMYSLNATGNVYFGISAPNITANYTETYNFEIAMSLDAYYHQYYSGNNTELWWMDSDSNSALLWSRNLTDSETESQTIMRRQELPYDIFIQNDDDESIDGLQHSCCGLQQRAELWGTTDTTPGKGSALISMAFTTRGPGGFAKQQFYLEGLNASSSYSGILVQTKNTTNSTSSKHKRATSVGGGGIVFHATSFNTSGGTNCKVVTDLEFCNETQYAVPGNDKKYNNTQLAKVYDDYAKSMYANFEKVLMQIPCQAPSQSRYSLARDCDNCRAAYKRWLCTVAIPRCEDFAGNSTTSIYRNVNQAFPNGTFLSQSQRDQLGKTPGFNASRNSFIDTTIKPGPYKELLPCEDLCYDVVQSCPAAMSLSCPQPNNPSFNYSYGRRNNKPGDDVTCNYPGEARTQASLATAILPSALMLGVLPLMMWLGV